MGESQAEFLVGMDIGSTTAKVVVARSDSQGIIWKDYQRHGTYQAEKALEFLRKLERDLGIGRRNCRLFFTGSGAADLADLTGAKYVQEVTAVSLAVERIHPEAQSVVELGGQDAKIIVFKPTAEGGGKRKRSSMNDKCAGGTGAVIDKIAAKLNIGSDRLGELRYSGIRVHPVAGKCGVFAETDINSLKVQGVAREELMASLFDAIVLQNLTVLTRGHTLRPVVLLLGGPNTFIPGMVEAWRRRIPGIWAERGVQVPDADLRDLIAAPPDAQYFGAIGAVEFGRGEEETVGRYRGRTALERYIAEGRLQLKLSSGAAGLVESSEEAEGFAKLFRRRTHSPSAFQPGEKVRAFVGIDGGSTSTKAVLLSERENLLAKAYRLSNGNPIQDMITVLGTLKDQVEKQGATLDVMGVGTTGYAKDVLKDVISADVALVETVAHAKSALKYYRNPHVIVDVGGQDIKLILLKNGHVKDFMLNSQCSAGNGYFLQSTAEGFGVPIDRYAEVAFSARAMPVFGFGCAVFLQADIVNFQRQGWKAEEILAGLAAVLPKNIWLYVAKMPNLSRLGTRFVLQGGTQNNLAAVKAQVDYITRSFEGSGKQPEVIVHRHCGEAGAIGAAMAASEQWRKGRRTRFIGLERVQSIQYRVSCDEGTRCRFCSNKCLRTFVDVHLDGHQTASRLEVNAPVAERRLIVATCEKGSVEDVEAMRGIKARIDAVKADNPNLVEMASRLVWRSQRPRLVADAVPARAWTRALGRRISLMRRRRKLRVGIPRVLNMYLYAPLFSAYLESLGAAPGNLVYSSFTSETMYRKGARRGSIDPCFPSKVALAHVHELIFEKHRIKPLDCIFFPMISTLDSPLHNTLGQSACCSVTLTPNVVKAAFTKESDVFKEQGLQYLEPLLDLNDRRLFGQQMLEAWGPVLGLTQEENDRAVEEGFAALRRCEARIRSRARRVIDRLEREDRLGIVVLGRAYHHDSGLNQGILEELQKRGYPILSQSTLPLDDDLLERLFGEEVRKGRIAHPLDITDVWQNAYSAAGSTKIWAAKFTARHPNLVALEISSFNCGQDAPIYSVCESIIESSGTPFFSFKDLDENKPAGSFKIRVETIDYFLSRYREKLRGLHRKRQEIQVRLDQYERRLRAEISAEGAPQRKPHG